MKSNNDQNVVIPCSAVGKRAQAKEPVGALRPLKSEHLACIGVSWGSGNRLSPGLQTRLPRRAGERLSAMYQHKFLSLALPLPYHG